MEKVKRKAISRRRNMGIKEEYNRWEVEKEDEMEVEKRREDSQLRL